MKISVVIPTKNNATTIKKVLDNVLRSLMRIELPWEIVIVDAHSTDGTSDILNEYSRYVKVLRDEGKGIGAARNLGVKGSDGDIIFFIDADCIVEHDHFNKLLNGFETNDIGIVWTSGVWFKLPNKREYRLMNAHLEAYSEIEDPRQEGLSLIASTALSAIRRDVLERVGGFWELPFASEDMDLSYRVLKAGYKIRKVCTKSISLPRTTIKEMMKQQVWYGRGASLVYFKYGRDGEFWRIHGWDAVYRLGFPLNYIVFILGALMSLFVSLPFILIFSPSLTLKKKRVVRLSPLSALIYEVVDRVAYLWGLLTGLKKATCALS